MKDIFINSDTWNEIVHMTNIKFIDIDPVTSLEVMMERVTEGLLLIGWLYGDRVYLVKKGWRKDMVEMLDQKCECGAEKCKTTHATWCPVY